MLVKNENEWCWCFGECVGYPQKSIEDAVKDFAETYLAEEVPMIRVGNPYYYVPTVDADMVISNVVDFDVDDEILDTTLCDGRKLIVKPDVIADFRKMPFEDESFHLVVFDPPHLVKAGDKSFLAMKYGRLEQTWQEDIKQGLSECWRVLKPNGTMIFKWNEEQITLTMVKGLLPSEPIFGQRRGKTVWLVFFKK